MSGEVPVDGRRADPLRYPCTLLARYLSRIAAHEETGLVNLADDYFQAQIQLPALRRKSYLNSTNNAFRQDRQYKRIKWDFESLLIEGEDARGTGCRV